MGRKSRNNFSGTQFYETTIEETLTTTKINWIEQEDILLDAVQDIIYNSKNGDPRLQWVNARDIVRHLHYPVKKGLKLSNDDEIVQTINKIVHIFENFFTKYRYEIENELETIRQADDNDEKITTNDLDDLLDTYTDLDFNLIYKKMMYTIDKYYVGQLVRQ
jgi:hypothetical protein